VFGEITSLQHEARDDTVEFGTRIAIAVLACGKLSEVLCSKGDDVIVKLEYDSTCRLFVYCDIKLRVKTLK
jgi:hypothetical protein